MSLKPKEKRSHTTETINKRIDRKIDLSVFDKINGKINSQSVIHKTSVNNSNAGNNSVIFNSDSVFKKRVDKLNIKFYFESEKYLNSKSETEKCSDQLYVILFKQISIYIEEVERLSSLLKEKIEDEKILKEKLEEHNKNEKDKNFSFIELKNLKIENFELQKKLEEKTKSEERLRKENEILRRNLKFCEEKLEKFDLGANSFMNENSSVTVKKKINNTDNSRTHPNSAFKTKLSTQNNCMNKLRPEDYLTNNSTSSKTYIEEDSQAHAFGTNYLRNSLLSNEEEYSKPACNNIETIAAKNFNTIINPFNSHNNQNIVNNFASSCSKGDDTTNHSIDKKSIISINIKSPSKNNASNSLAVSTVNKNAFSFRKSGINNQNTKSVSNGSSNVMGHINYTNSINFSQNSIQNSKDFKIIKSIKQKNKANSQDSVIKNKIFPTKIEGDLGVSNSNMNNMKSQSLQINMTNQVENVHGRNSFSNIDSIYTSYLDTLQSEMNYLADIEKDLCEMIQSHSEKLQMDNTQSTDIGPFSSFERQINICENYYCADTYDPLIKSKETGYDPELEEGYKSGPCFFPSHNKTLIGNADFTRSHSIENEKNNYLKRSFVNNGNYPITTTIYLDVEKKKKANERNNSNNRNNITSSSPPKNKLNINYLRKVKTIK